MSDNDEPLAGRRIAVPESRQLDLFAEMLESRGAEVLRCPLVDIHDAPDPGPIEAWLRAFADGTCDDVVLLTGEGLRRLLGFAERAGGDLRERFVAALGDTRKITRGPKPARALRDLGLRPDLTAAAPTTEGVIETLLKQDLGGRTVGVQLYGTEPNRKLMDFLAGAGAEAMPVAPYVYADQSEDTQVAGLIEALAGGRVDAIAFTSSPQVRRLFAVARKHELEESLQATLDRIVVAAVGPIVADALAQREVTVDLMPESSYFMKPLVRALAARFGGGDG
ncbi:uroporphyrinogen III synthase HEM4 [Salinisphaera sp. PC39]|uniref:uroporphyrinogen-III synthase n=1 Tax=Salinisphaera sp. PC39 TaxID=1304156 RepID=UPI00333F85F7